MRARKNYQLLDDLIEAAQNAAPIAEGDQPSDVQLNRLRTMKNAVAERMVEPPYVPPPCKHCGQSRDGGHSGVVSSGHHHSRMIWSCRSKPGSEYSPQEET